MGQLTRNEVFTLAVQKYSDAVYRAAMHNSRCAADAEDVVQDVYEKLLHYNGTFESEEHLKAWLLRVAGNLSKNRLDYNARRSTDELKEELAAQGREDLSFVWEAVKQLPQEQRACIHLFYYEGYPTRDVARMLGRKESTIRSDLRRGREKLKKLLKKLVHHKKNCLLKYATFLQTNNLYLFN